MMSYIEYIYRISAFSFPSRSMLFVERHLSFSSRRAGRFQSTLQQVLRLFFRCCSRRCLCCNVHIIIYISSIAINLREYCSMFRSRSSNRTFSSTDVLFVQPRRFLELWRLHDVLFLLSLSFFYSFSL